jgi:hypothetical protein
MDWKGVPLFLMGRKRSERWTDETSGLTIQKFGAGAPQGDTQFNITREPRAEAGSGAGRSDRALEIRKDELLYRYAADDGVVHRFQALILDRRSHEHR